MYIQHMTDIYQPSR